MKAIIVDDEPRAIELIKSYLEHFNSIELAATFRNGLKAFEYLSKEKVDLVFLDINMPHISGISLSKMLPKELKIIFTTAYSEFAVESYEVQAVDYLLKPISLERFAKSISRILAKEVPVVQTNNKWVVVKSGFESFRIATDQILYLEKNGNYITYQEVRQKITGRETIQEALEKLPGSFLQIHKSFIVNLDKISSYDRNFLVIGNNKIPVGDAFREKLFQVLGE